MSHTKAEWLKALEIAAVYAPDSSRAELFEEAGKILDMIDDVIEEESALLGEEPRLPLGWEFAEDPYCVGGIWVRRYGSISNVDGIWIRPLSNAVINNASVGRGELDQIVDALRSEIARRSEKERC